MAYLRPTGLLVCNRRDSSSGSYGHDRNNHRIPTEGTIRLGIPYPDDIKLYIFSLYLACDYLNSYKINIYFLIFMGL